MTIGDSSAWVDHRPLPAPVAPGDLLRWLLGAQRASLAMGVTSAILWMGSIAAVPFVLGRVVDEGIAASDAGALLLWLGALAALGVAEAAAGAVRHRHACLLWERSALAIGDLVARRALDPGGGVERHVGPGAAVSLATSDAEALGGPVDLMCRGIAAVITFAAVAAMVFATAPVLGLVLVAGLPLMVLAMVPLWRPLDRRAGARQRTLAASADLAVDAVSGLATIKGLHAVPAARAGYRTGTREVRAAALGVARLAAGWEALGVIVPGLFLAATAWLGGRLALDGTISSGELVACFGYAAFLVTPVRTFGEVGEVWAQGMASARRVAALLNVDPAVVEAPAPVPVGPEAGGELRLEGVTAGQGALDGLDLAVGGGRHVGVVGAAPGVLRTLGDLLARSADPDFGRVALDGVDVRTLALDELRRRVVCAEHEAFLFAGTLRDNLLPARPGATEAELRRALHVAAADDLAPTAEELGRVVAERGRSLSGGERQRVALARAVLGDPPVLVLDAPTHAVDAVTELQIADRLLAARAGRTTLVLEPGPALAQRLDEVVLLDGGRVRARGRHADLLHRDAAYRRAVRDA